MANRLMTNDEVNLEIGVPMLRAIIRRCMAAKKPALMGNVFPDLMPVAIEPMEEEEGIACLAKCDAMEAELRERIAKHG